jgi:hypothetical protein
MRIALLTTLALMACTAPSTAPVIVPCYELFYSGGRDTAIASFLPSALAISPGVTSPAVATQAPAGSTPGSWEHYRQHGDWTRRPPDSLRIEFERYNSSVRYSLTGHDPALSGRVIYWTDILPGDTYKVEARLASCLRSLDGYDITVAHRLPAGETTPP